MSATQPGRLFRDGELRDWLRQKRADALKHVQQISPDEILERPPEQIADDLIDRFSVERPHLAVDEAEAEFDDVQMDVSRDPMRGGWMGDGPPLMIPATRISLHAPYRGPAEALRLRATTSTLSSPAGDLANGEVTVWSAVPGDSIERDGRNTVETLRKMLQQIAQFVGYAGNDIAASNAQLETEIRRAVEARRAKVLADRNLAASIDIPLRRDAEVAKTYAVAPVNRKRPPARPVKRVTGEAFEAEPTLADEVFAEIVIDIDNTLHQFERLAVTYHDLNEERLRDQILGMLGNVYGSPTGETFSKRGKTDIYLPYGDTGAVFLAECKWWAGEKTFAEKALPQLLDGYVVWRDTHAAMILFIRNKDASTVIDKAVATVRAHSRFVRDADSIGDVPVFVLQGRRPEPGAQVGSHHRRHSSVIRPGRSFHKSGVDESGVGDVVVTGKALSAEFASPMLLEEAGFGRSQPMPGMHPPDGPYDRVGVVDRLLVGVKAEPVI